MKTKNILLVLGVLLVAWIGIGSQIPTILPVSPVTEFVDFLKGLKSTGPLEIGPVGRNLKTWWNFEDFIAGPGAPMGIWGSYSSGTGAQAIDIVGTALRPGIWKLETGTTTTGFSSIRIHETAVNAPFLFGVGIYTLECDIYIGNLSTVSEAHTLRFGFGDVPNADFVDGAYFEYTNTGSTPNWYKCTASNSTRTKTDTTIAAVAGAWTRLKLIVNSAGTSVEYFINGISAGVVTTNIPTGTGRETSAMFHIIKSAGTTDRAVDIDWTWLHVDLTTSR